MKLFELQSGAIEKELKKKANSIDDAGIGDDVPPEEESKDGGEDFTDLDSPMGGGQQDMNMMNQPDIPTDAEETEEELDQAMLKKVDSALMTATKKLSYANDYTHDEKSKIHPFRILQMEMGELVPFVGVATLQRGAGERMAASAHRHEVTFARRLDLVRPALEHVAVTRGLFRRQALGVRQMLDQRGAFLAGQLDAMNDGHARQGHVPAFRRLAHVLDAAEPAIRGDFVT